MGGRPPGSAMSIGMNSSSTTRARKRVFCSQHFASSDLWPLQRHLLLHAVALVLLRQLFQHALSLEAAQQLPKLVTGAPANGLGTRMEAVSPCMPACHSSLDGYRQTIPGKFCPCACLQAYDRMHVLGMEQRLSRGMEEGGAWAGGSTRTLLNSASSTWISIWGRTSPRSSSVRSMMMHSVGLPILRQHLNAIGDINRRLLDTTQ